MEIYTDYGMKVRNDVIQSFQEYNIFINALNAMGINQTTFAKAYDCGETDDYDNELAVYADTLSQSEIDAIIESSAEGNILDALDLKLYELYINIKRAFTRRYRGYSIQVRYIDNSQDQYIGCSPETMIFVIINPYKTNIYSIAATFSIATTE